MTLTAFIVGLLCGVAWAHAPRYRLALTAYMAVLAATHFAGITAPDPLLDAVIVAGVLLLCFGITRGLVAMLWERRPDNAHASTIQAGPASAVQADKPSNRPKPRSFV